MAIAKYAQDPDEVKRYQIDYSEWLDTGEQAASVTFGVTPTTTPPLEVTDDMILPSGQGVQYYVSGGVDGTTYRITATLTTDSDPAQVREDDIVMQVREQ